MKRVTFNPEKNGQASMKTAAKDFNTQINIARDKALQNGNLTLAKALRKAQHTLWELENQLLNAVCELQNVNGGEV